MKYKKVLFLPAVFMIVLTAVSFLTIFFLADHTQHMIFYLISGFFALAGYAIYFYAGWLVTRTCKGKLKHAALFGLILGLFQAFLSTINMVLTYFFTTLYEPIKEVGEIFGDIMYIFFIIGVIGGYGFSLLVGVAVTMLGGYVGLKKK
ncbi:MAG: hypothetical protein ACMXYF_03925 [Candidatus Woesearchaeota archaeon]